jgi:hypothetical protein
MLIKRIFDKTQLTKRIFWGEKRWGHFCIFWGDFCIFWGDFCI